MDHLAFYNAGCESTRGPASLSVRLRRLVRGLLRPMFLRLVEILGSLCYRLDVAERDAEDIHRLLDDLRRRQEEQAARFPSTLAFGWDYVAMVRRLAILEEHVETLLAERDAAGASGRWSVVSGQQGKCITDH